MKNPRLAGLGRSEKVGKTLGRPTGAGGTGSSMYRRKNVRPGREFPRKEAHEAPRRPNSGKQACSQLPCGKFPRARSGALRLLREHRMLSGAIVVRVRAPEVARLERSLPGRVWQPWLKSSGERQRRQFASVSLQRSQPSPCFA